MNPLDKDYRFMVTISGRAVARLLPIAFAEKLSVRQILQRLVTNYALTLPPHSEHVHGIDLWRMWRTKRPLASWPRWMLQQLFRYEWGEGALEEALRQMEQEALEEARRRDLAQVKPNRTPRYFLVRRQAGGGYERVSPRAPGPADRDVPGPQALEGEDGALHTQGDGRSTDVEDTIAALARGEGAGWTPGDTGGDAGRARGGGPGDRAELDADGAELSDPQREDGQGVGEASEIVTERVPGHSRETQITGVSLRDLVLRDFGPGP